jgi:hypothetical protein
MKIIIVMVIFKKQRIRSGKITIRMFPTKDPTQTLGIIIEA